MWAQVNTTLDPVRGCGRPFSAPQRSQRFLARTVRTNRDRSFQSAGYLFLISGRMGTDPPGYHFRQAAQDPALCARLTMFSIHGDGVMVSPVAIGKDPDCMLTENPI